MAFVIFDFDGTLADVKALFMDLGNEIAAKKGWPEITDAVYEKLRKGNIKDGIKSLGIPLRELPYLVLQAKRLLLPRAHEIKLFTEVDELISKLTNDGHELFVLSTNSKKAIKIVLEQNKLADKLNVLPSSGLFGKAPAIKRFMRSHKADKKDVWYVGDELRDIEAAKKAGVSSIAVTWGLQHPDSLRDAKPTYVANTPLQIFERISSSA